MHAGSLQEALNQGLLILRGGNHRVEASLRNPFVLDLFMVNMSPAPVRIALKRGAIFTPAGQSPGRRRYMDEISTIGTYNLWGCQGRE